MRRLFTLPALLGALLLAGCSRDAAISTAPTVHTAPRPEPVARPEHRLPAEPGLSDYLALAALRNPGLKATWYRWRAARERAPQVRSLPDPMLRYSYFVREVETRVGPQRHKLGLSQRIPWPGKLVLAGQVADRAAAAERKRYDAAKLALFHRVKGAYYEYWYLKRAIEITRVNVELVRHLEAVARARYKTAAGGHPDVIRAQVELGKLEDRLKSLREMRAALSARLNALLDRPTGALLAWPKQAPPKARLAEKDAGVLEALRRSNPDLAALALEIERAQKAVRLARHRYLPDFTLGVDWILTDDPEGPLPADDRGKDPVAVGIGITLPLWFGKHRAAGREARARLAGAQLARRDRENLLLARVKRVLYEVRDAERKVELYGKTLLPKAEEALKATEAAFKGGKASFLDLTEAQRVRLEFQLAAEKARARHAQKLAALEMLVGRSVKLTPAAEERSEP